MLLIDNQRISDQSWSADMADALSEALRGADAGVMAEAYAYVGDDGNGVGPHHEVRDDVLIVNRQGVWRAMGELSYPAPPAPGETPAPAISLSLRCEAQSHLRRHMRMGDDVPIGE